jgi:DNA ligase-1
VQIHRKGEEVRIFSRRLTEVTDSLPEIVELARELSPHNFIVDGEVIAFRDRPLPFQDLMRRFRRVGGMEEIRRIVPVRLFLFDILMREGEELMDLPYGERHDLLSAMVPSEMLVPRIVTSSTEEGMTFFERSLREGHEGLMAKDMESPYITGKGGRRWLKIKRSHNLDLIIVAAEWGHGRRRGWLSDYYLAAVDGDGYSIVGKTFKGLTDEEFKWMTSRLLDLKIDEEDHVMRVEPQVVVEVAFDEIQTSSRYPSGMTLRFARIKAIREDKDPVEADPIEEVERIYEAQFLSRDRLDGETDREGSKQ